MGNVRIYNDKLHEAQAAAKALEESLEKAYDTCEQLISYVNSAKWSGKARDTFLSYLEIIRPYHKDINKAVSKQTKALNHLDRNIGDFSQDSSVREVRNL